MVKSRTYIATPPGATIKEQLTDRGMSQKEFAFRMDMSEKHISRLINGDVQLTADVAMRLEMVLGLPAHFWNNLESIYREKLIMAQAENEMEADKKIIKKLPYKEMSEIGWVKETRSNVEKVINARKFFEVTQLKLITDMPVQWTTCRPVDDAEKNDYAFLAWKQKIKLEARKNRTGNISIDRLVKNIPDIRKMTLQKPEEFIKNLCNVLLDCGISLVFIPKVSQSVVNGTSFYDGPRIDIGLSADEKNADRFWFSLFHEFGHIILGHIGKQEGTTEDDEKKADSFARDTLIPMPEYEEFTRDADFGRNSVIRFAKKIDIAPGIVVGRLQDECYIPYGRHKELNSRYKIIS